MKNRKLVEGFSNAEVYEMAGVLLRQHGKDAAVYASMQAGKKLSMGDMTGYRIWKRLVMLVDGIFEKAPPEQSCLH
jgi:hypothetical protein